MKPLALCGGIILLLSVLLTDVESIDEDRPPVVRRFHCRRNGCCDHHEWCRFWASVGECKSNADWMVDNCQLACNTCRAGPSSRARNPLTTKRPPPITRRPPQTTPVRTTTPRPTTTTRPLPQRRPRPTTPRRFFTRRPVFRTNRPRFRVTTTRPRFTTTSNGTVALRRHRLRLHKGISHHLPHQPKQTNVPFVSIAKLTEKFHKPDFLRVETPATTTFLLTTTTSLLTTTTPTTTTTTTTPTTTTTTTPTTTTTTPTTTTTIPTTTTTLATTTTTFPTTTTTMSTTTTTTTQDPRTRPTTPFFRQTTTTTRAPTRNNDQRCRDILRDPVFTAEDMLRERIVVSTEQNSRRRTVDLDQVIRSNLANACVPRMDESDCDSNMCYNAYFRTMDGTCNNMQNPLRGAAYRPYTRLLPTIYDNELSEPVASLFPDLRPSPREITRHLTSSHASVLSKDYNALIMQFGQFTSHDMAKTTLVPSAKCNVCQNITSRCMSVPVTHDDTNDGFRKSTCIRVSRSSPICGSGRTKPRQQLNENSGYIDVSPIYGSSVHDSMKFREGNTGFLKQPVFHGFPVLPFDQSRCKSRQSCTVIFTAGDSRVNLFVGLGAWHTIFTREHNRVARALQRFNPHWDGDRLYHEARKIVGAEMQAIVYREWLPKVLGAAFATVVGDYKGYDPNVDSTVANEFTSAAFRFGHGMIQETYQRLDPNFFNSSFGLLEFQKGTLHSDVLVNEGGPDPLLRGMFSQPVKRPQRITSTVTENMFGSTDLSSINIQRGRDHGHPSYTKYRELCGMGVATNFDHLSREILDTGTRDKLQKVYGHVDKIDLWVGVLMEDPIIRGLVGPTAACIIGPQFKRTRDGDRFYYENPGIFTRQQLSEIRKSSLSRIICDNSPTITMVPREAFRLGHLTPCNQIPQMDLSRWKE